jgi:hypothetical protein
VDGKTNEKKKKQGKKIEDPKWTAFFFANADLAEPGTMFR